MAAQTEVENIVSLIRPLALLALLLAAPARADLHALVVSGLGGEDDYERKFLEQAGKVAAAAAGVAGDASRVTALTGERARRETLERELRAMAARVTRDDQVAVIFIGHGSFDGEEYRLNLPGPDITGAELAVLLGRLRAQQQLILNATSASGAVIGRWKQPNRILITATRSGNERNATRFAEFWIEALSSGEADRDKNNIITAAEAFEFASGKVADAFKSDVALATEHAMLEGRDASLFHVARLGTAASFVADATLDALLGEQVGVERQLEELKARKPHMAVAAYYDELEKVLVAMARLQRRIDGRRATLGDEGVRGSNAPQAR